MRISHRFLGAFAALCVPICFAGCEVDVGPPDGVAVGPGYYYDDAWVDVGGIHHPREYWYHDEHGWAHRDALPRGVEAHDRAGFGYVHGAAPRGGGGEPHGGGGHGGR